MATGLPVDLAADPPPHEVAAVHTVLPGGGSAGRRVDRPGFVREPVVVLGGERTAQFVLPMANECRAPSSDGA